MFSHRLLLPCIIIFIVSCLQDRIQHSHEAMALADNIPVPKPRLRFRPAALEGGSRRGRALHTGQLYIPQGRNLGEGALSRRSQTRKYSRRCSQRVGSQSAAIGT